MKQQQLALFAAAAGALFLLTRKANAAAPAPGASLPSGGGTTPGAIWGGVVNHPNQGTIGTMPYVIPPDFGVVDPGAGW